MNVKQPSRNKKSKILTNESMMDMPQTSLQLTPKGSKIVLKGKDSKLSILHLDKW